MTDNPPGERDDRGKFRKGVSGNPAGRPRKKPDGPRSLEKMLADELQREVTFEDVDGNKRKGTQYEMICANIINQLTQAKPREAIAVLKDLRKLGILHEYTGANDDGPREIKIQFVKPDGTVSELPGPVSGRREQENAATSNDVEDGEDDET